jgi:hypothetical protein
MKKIIIIAITIIALTSCKKSSSVTTGGPSTNNSGGVKNGYLTATRSYQIYGSNMMFAGKNATALFYTPTGFVYAGAVYIDTTKLRFSASLGNVYSDTTGKININPTTWKVAGNGSVPSFTYTNNDSIPGYTGFALLPDTIYKSANLDVHVDGVTGASQIMVMLIDNASPAHSVSKSITTVSINNTITIPSFSLTPLATSAFSPCSMTISIEKINDQTISGSAFEFAAEKMIMKNVYIK